MVLGKIAALGSRRAEQYIYFFGQWEPAVTQFIRASLGAGDTFVDAGANMGYYSLLGSTLVGPTGSVVAIEPSAANASRLRTNLALNEAHNVRVIEAAVGARRERRPLFRGVRHNTGEATLLSEYGSEIEHSVEVYPLADVLTDDELRTCRVIKIDVEGAEAEVLAGLEGTLHQLPARAELIVEVHPQYLAWQGRSVGDLVRTLESAGFHAFLLENDYWVGRYLSGEPPPRPQRLTGPVRGEAVLVFSRRNTAFL